MFLRSAIQVLNLIDGKNINLVGCGNTGRELLEFLIAHKVSVERIYDNDSYRRGKRLLGIPIHNLDEIENTEEVFVVAVSEQYRTELLSQLLINGIDMKKILIYSPWRDYDYVSSLDENKYKDEVSAMFRDCHGYDMDWDNPKSYSELICWEKLNVKDEIRTRLADKCLARNWVAERIGDSYLTEQFGTWKEANDINFSNLPGAFVLKTNNGSGRNIIVKDKREIDEKKIIADLTSWLRRDYFFPGLEYQYKGIKPKVICEELLDSENPSFYDCKIYCFHGNPMYIHCIRDEHQPSMRARFYDTKWNLQKFNHAYRDDPAVIRKPRCLEEMLEKTQILCKDFKHVRVDWFMLPGGRFLFSEMTFSSWGGLERFHPVEFDDYFGKLIRGES